MKLFDAKLDGPYLASEYEPEVLKFWEEKKYSQAKLQKGKKNFVIATPPSNVTGELHIGHITPFTFIDIFGRYHRMLGENVLLIPGTDHAAIAAQNVVEKQLKKQGLSKEKLGRTKFIEEMWKFMQEYRPRIEKQMKAVGVSVDWSRNHFTMDNDLTSAVHEAFSRLKKAGLIYQDEYLINWCPRCGTALSDDEVFYQKQKAKLFTFRYSKDFPISIATTRPETKLGDTAIAVHPENKKYQKFIGKTYEINFLGVPLKIKIIADKSVSAEFGTGAVGITPAHALADWEIAQKHNLKIVKVIDEHGKILPGFGEFSGLKTLAAREKIVEKLQKQGLLEKEAEIENNLSVCYRCETPIEPRPSKQYFVKIAPLAKLARDAVEKGEIEIVPNYLKKNYFNWMDNIHDWCISRQLWWGHPLPEKGSQDVLDTWFSSALWPFATLGWPKKTSDFENFYPTTMMITGSDILFFWVARMIMFGEYFTGCAPFKTVLMHGLIMDAHGKKMSKSKGNVINPIPMIEKYGADALRIAVITGNTPGNNISLSENKIQAYRNFSNKIWNATKFVIGNLQDFTPKENLELDPIWKNKLKEIISVTESSIKGNHVSIGAEMLYDFFWHSFCDKCIESSKLKIQSSKQEEKIQAQNTLYVLLVNSLKLLHPYIPFVTEVCWQKLKKNIKNNQLEESLMIAKWPKAEDLD